MNSTASNIYMLIFVRKYIFFCGGTYLGVKLLGFTLNCIFHPQLGIHVCGGPNWALSRFFIVPAINTLKRLVVQQSNVYF